MFDQKNDAEFIADWTVRQRLLAGAAQLFARKGYASTTVREIVEAAKVTKPALYYYFRNKEEIYLELMREAEARFEILLDSARKEIGEVKKRVLSFSAFFGPDRNSPGRDIHSLWTGPGDSFF